MGGADGNLVRRSLEPSGLGIRSDIEVSSATRIGWEVPGHRSVAGRRLRVPGRGHPAARGPSLRCRAWHPGRHQGTRATRRANRHSTIHSGTDRPPGRHGWRVWNRPTGSGWSAPGARWRGVAIRPSRAGRVDRLAAGRPAPPSSGTDLVPFDRADRPGVRGPGRTSGRSWPWLRQPAPPPPRTRTARGTLGTCRCAAPC